MKAIVVILAALFLVEMSVAQGGAHPTLPTLPITLTPGSVQDLTVPPFGWMGAVRCDQTGNLYFHAVKALNDSLILKISVTNGGQQFYTLSNEDAANTYFVAFQVSSGGNLWLLAHGNKRGLFLFEFENDKPTSPRRIELQVPDNLDAKSSVVLPNGHVLLQGYYNENASEATRKKCYFGEFSETGSLVRSSLGNPLSAEDQEDPLAAITDASAALTEDSLYLLTGGEITVLSPSGSIVRKFPVKMTDGGYTAFSMYADKRNVAVVYIKAAKQESKTAARANGKFPVGPAIFRFALFDGFTGDRLRVYDPDPDLRSSTLVCYTGDEFEFWRGKFEGKEVKIQIVTAHP